jgi:hypothetical protein
MNDASFWTQPTWDAVHLAQLICTYRACTSTNFSLVVSETLTTTKFGFFEDLRDFLGELSSPLSKSLAVVLQFCQVVDIELIAIPIYFQQ